MPAPKGNQFWRARATHGRDKIFKTPDDLWSACCEYFDWVEENPLMESKAFAFQGSSWIDEIPKMRAMTISGLCLFLDVSEETWSKYRKKEDYVGVTRKAEQIIRQQKFSGAAADLLNPNIIARDLGLGEKIEHSGNPDKPLNKIDASALSSQALQELLDARKNADTNK